MSCTATAWLGMPERMVIFPRPMLSCLRLAPSVPMRSTMPLARMASVSMSKSWYFRDELPQFTVRVFMDSSEMTGAGRGEQGAEADSTRSTRTLQNLLLSPSSSLIRWRA